MHIRSHRLGIVDAIFTGFALKNLLGIGRKKRQLKAIEGQARGYWTSQLPADIDWSEYGSRGPIDKYGHTVRAQYDWLRGRKDSMLIKNNIASAEDHAAWFFLQHAIPAIESGAENLIPNHVSGVRYDKLPDPQAPQGSSAPSTSPIPAALQPSAAPPPPPQIVVPPPSAPQALAPLLPTASPAVQNFFPGGPSITSGSGQSASAATTPQWLIPAAIGGAALLIVATQRRRR